MQNKHELWELQSMQAAPLSVKVSLTKQRIREWVDAFGEDGVYVSFSGGKDSTVLLHLVRELYPNVPAVFCDTGLEFPSIRDFVKTFDNVVWLKPKMTFKQVIEKYGYPMISKEVAECVFGARKYLTSIIESENAVTDRQTDSVQVSTRQTPRARYVWGWSKLTGTGKYSTDSGGGADRYRQRDPNLLEWYVGSRSGETVAGQRWTEDHNEGGQIHTHLAALTGTFTAGGCINAGWYRQLQSPEDVGNPAETGDGNDGDYP